MPTRYVNTASTAGGDGTTNLTSGATRAYVSLTAWEAARQATIAAVEEVICEGATADGTAVTISGWTTTASFYIDIKALTSASAGRHAGVWSTSKYRLSAANAQFGALQIDEPFVRVTGLQIENTEATDFAFGLMCTAGVTSANDDTRFDAVIVRNTRAVTGNGGEGVFLLDGRFTVTNCVSYGNGGNGIYIAFGGNGPPTAFVYNCVSAGNGETGFQSDDDTNIITARNNYAGGNTGADFQTLFINGSATTTSHNASEDATGEVTSVAYSTSAGAFFTNITPGSQDYHIGTSSVLKDAGTNLAGTFTTDIDGQTRGATWDIGADEFVVAAGNDINVFLQEPVIGGCVF